MGDGKFANEHSILIADSIGKSPFESSNDVMGLGESPDSSSHVYPEFYTQLFRHSPLATAFLDPSGRILDVNKKFTDLFGYERDEIRGLLSGRFIASGNYLSEAISILSRVLSGENVIGESLRKHKSNRLIPVRLYGTPVFQGDEVIGAFAVYEDISERRALESELHNKSYFDDLTGLPNTEYLTDCIFNNRGRKTADGKTVVILIGLNRFSRVNGSLGRAAGDTVLMEIANRIRKVSRFQDMQARCGGDKFAVLLSGLKSRDKAEQVACRYLEVIEKPLEVDDCHINLSASIGVVYGTENYDDAVEVLNDAEIALNNAKDSAVSRIQFFIPPMHEQVAMASQMELDMQRCLSEDAFQLAYQPVVCTRTGELRSYEALLRWDHPTMGPIPPDRFIPLAEETGLIVPVGRWVLERALKDLAEFSYSIGKQLSMSVNISVKQLLMDDLSGYLEELLEKHGLDPELLKIEITESVFLKPELLPRLEELRRTGVKIGIDDFGKGYSSLSYLQDMPVDFLKIDKSFVSGNGKADKEIVSAIITLADRLGLKVVAEGVETFGQLELLRELGCGFAQGYYFSRPVSKHEAGMLPSIFE